MNVYGGSGNIILSNGGLGANPNTTLNMTAERLSGGTLADGGVYTILNIATTGSASTLANIAFSATTKHNVTGTHSLTLSSAAGLAALSAVTVSASAGLVANFSGARLTAVNASATSGRVVATLIRASYEGGTGADAVTLTSVPARTISGGAGVDGKITMTASAAATAKGSSTFAGFVTGFEKLVLTGPPTRPLTWLPYATTSR